MKRIKTISALKELILQRERQVMKSKPTIQAMNNPVKARHV